MRASEKELITRQDVQSLISDGEWHLIGQITVACWSKVSDDRAIWYSMKKNPRKKCNKDDKTLQQLMAMSSRGRTLMVRDICGDLRRDRVVKLRYDDYKEVYKVKLRPKREWRHHSIR